MECIEKKRYVRIGLFGVSRSGKNYTIDDFMDIARSEGVEFIHLSPMDMIRSRLGDTRLKDMSKEAKKSLVKEVRKEIDVFSEAHNIVVDEHFCYPESFGGMKLENGYYDEKLPHDILRSPEYRVGYEVVFPRFESMKYDLLAVLNIDPGIIVERCRTSEGTKYNPYITEDEVAEWERVEIDGLKLESSVPIVQIEDPRKSGSILWDSVKPIMGRSKHSF